MNLNGYSVKMLQKATEEAMDEISARRGATVLIIKIRQALEVLHERMVRLERGDVDEWCGPPVDHTYPKSPRVDTTANNQYGLFKTTVE